MTAGLYSETREAWEKWYNIAEVLKLKQKYNLSDQNSIYEQQCQEWRKNIFSDKGKLRVFVTYKSIPKERLKGRFPKRKHYKRKT